MQTIYTNQEEYILLEQKIKEFEFRQNELKPLIIDEIKQKGITNENGFTIASRKKYTYTEKITEMMDEVKIQKIEEEEKGLATFETTEYIIYKPNLKN